MRKHLLWAAFCAAMLFQAGMGASEARAETAPLKAAPADFPCAGSVNNLIVKSQSDPDVRATLDRARLGMVDPPPSAAPQTNPWKGAKDVDELVARMVNFAYKWCTALPTIVGNNDDGLTYIGQNYWFFYKNDAAMHFARGESAAAPYKPFAGGFNYFMEFTKETGAFMSTKASAGNVRQWVDDPRVEIGDYVKTKTDEYTSWNDFFTRRLKTEVMKEEIPSRPVTMPDRDYVVSSPTDCIMNPIVQVFTDKQTGAQTRSYIDNPLQMDTVLDIKNIPITVAQLLRGVPDDVAKQFVGGNGLSCILMPNTYHHYHAPVSGTVVYAAVNTGTTYGYVDWPNLMPNTHNPAQPGTDFSQFEVYQRGVVVMEVSYSGAKPGERLKGYVASIPVGLDTIGSVILNKDIIPSNSNPKPHVKRGYTEIGYFQYGGSMNLLLFSKGLLTPSVQTRMGNQIGILNAPQQ